MLGEEGDENTVAVVARSQTRGPLELTFGDLREQVDGGPGRAAGPRCRAGRPRRRLPAEHPGDAHRLPRDGEPRCDLGGLPARVRPAQRDRPLRDARAEGHVRGRRLPLRRTCDRSTRRGGAAARGAADARARRRGSLRRRARRRAAGERRLGGAAGGAGGAARVRAGRLRSPAVRAVLLRHDRTAEGDRSRLTAGSSSSTSRTTG